MEALDISDITRQSQEIEVGGKHYTVSEPSEEAQKLFRARQLKGSKMVDGKLSRESLEGIGEIPSYLVHLCTKNGDDKPVPQSEVMAWPARVVQRVYAWLEQFIKQAAETEDSINEEIRKLQERLEEIRDRKKSPKA